MPAYNCEQFVAQAIDSILNQTYSNIELLIADDASKDKTRGVIDQFKDSRIRTFHNDKNLGYLKTWNNLIDKATGEYITFMDGDDYSALNRIELQVNTLEADISLGLCGSNFVHVTEDNKEMEWSDFPLSHKEVFELIPEQFNIIGSALMIKREVYERIGKYNVFFDRIGKEDYYWAYMAMEQFGFVNLKEHLYYYRFNPTSVSSDISSNPSKININAIVNLLIQQRRETGTDLLEQHKEHELEKMLNELNRPFVEDPSYFFYYVAKRRFYEGRKKLALQNMWKAIKKSPLRANYYKDFLYFLKN